MEKLLCINNYCIDPYFNLATEEYLLKNRKENVFMLWQNEPTVVVGKHQNIHAEINHDFVSEKNIKVARRLSGGGTVYHDLGNLNFTYIMTGKQGKMVDFTKYTNDILEVLNNLGADAVRNKRNDLIINDKKISGNAEHIFKQRVIHHGTLLFNSDLEVLDETIKVKQGKYTDKAVQSVRSKVTNILPHLSNKISLEEFRKALIDHILRKYKNTSLYELSENEEQAITALKHEKYTTWEWIYGYSPKYVLKRKIEKPEGVLNIELSIKKGIVEDAKFSGDLMDEAKCLKLNALLRGERHDKENLNKTLKQLISNKIFTNLESKDLIDHLF